MGVRGKGREALLQKGSLPLPPHIKMLFAPRGVALVPEGVERLRVTQGIHALPETGVAVHGKLAFGGKAFERLLLEIAGLVFREIVKKFALEHEEPAVDVFVQNGFFLPRQDACRSRRS